MAGNARMEAAPLPVTTVIGVVGAGAMGAGIAQVAALAGHPVRVFDTRAGAALEAVTGINDMAARLLGKGRISQTQAETVTQRLQAVETLEELAGCGLIVEAIIENLEVKRSLFRDVEKVVANDALLATNTSSISITAIAAALEHPQRLAGLHFFNPAPLMPLVEIIAGAATSPAVAQTLYATAAAWGKTPVLARSTPGFIVNRVARPFYAEALRTLNEQAADCATIDAVMREAGGFRMGPFELMDLIGHDVNYAVTRSVFDAFYGDTRFTPSLLQFELVQAGFLGRKTGSGFYQYGENGSSSSPAVCPREAPPSGVTLYGQGALATAIAERLHKAGVSFEHAAGHPNRWIATCDGCTLCETDGRTATARAAEQGLENIVLVDLALDPTSARRLAVTPADNCPPSALAAAAGLLQAAGFHVSPIDDIAGMIVLRTVVMLANEAADAVQQGVCTAEDCDLAMRKGVNYPRGPLAWADSLGVQAVVDVLDHLAVASGETRYRVSPLLRRKALSGRHLVSSEGSRA